MIGVLVGLVISAMFSAMCIPGLVISKGRIEFRRGLMKAADSLEREFGRYDGHTPCKVLFSIDRTNAVSIETNGVKTVRVLHEAF